MVFGTLGHFSWAFRAKTVGSVEDGDSEPGNTDGSYWRLSRAIEVSFLGDVTRVVDIGRADPPCGQRRGLVPCTPTLAARQAQHGLAGPELSVGLRRHPSRLNKRCAAVTGSQSDHVRHPMVTTHTINVSSRAKTPPLPV